ncbi:hypothetical protein [Chitinophaga alhagiae]|uniref:hypothetical protein n=1 Tax=Chitinophaga alhagiae TaxID=2203219 RepID=UPI000E5C31E7|nr:hypothetical protein [Chitinophaga alhagiae]
MFALFFKSLILGSVFTLAVHNICLDRLLSEDYGWQQNFSKQRKRKEENSSVTVYQAAEEAAAATFSMRQIPLLPSLVRLVRSFTASVIKNIIPADRFITRYIPEKIFLYHCVLLR